jgi:hypothetical protein
MDSESGLIADLSNITTSLDCYYYIVITTSTKTDIQVDIDEIATDLNGKADVDLSNCTKPHIVETYVNGSSWYRVYSDGWCEQGGVTSWSNNTTLTINLLKTYINTNYNVFTNCYGTYQDQLSNAIAVNDKTTSTFELRPYTNNRIANWQASGYIR